MQSKLESLKEFTTIVADTGDFAAIRQLKPEDATTNPSLLLKAAKLPSCQEHLQKALDQAAGDIDLACDHFAVAVGREILDSIPGRVSTEVDARLSFDTVATVARAQRIMKLYAEAGVPAERILIKIAATWEGIRAAEQLEKSGIQTNLTLLFSFAQAVACAEAGVFLISPFVGRIYDWYKKHEGRDYEGIADPGVQSVSRIYEYYKQHGYPTIVMGASFRNLGQIEALAGCDRLTISPDLLQQLTETEGQITRRLGASPAQVASPSPEAMSESQFRWAMNEDPMATEKLAEGIRQFAKDQHQLETLLSELAGRV